MNKARIIAELFKGKMTDWFKPHDPTKANFVICCRLGDWSGSLTLAECQKQYPELESRGRPDGYFWVEER